MTQFESDELDGMLRELLAIRPAPAAPADLARLAMRRGRVVRPAMARSRFRRVNWVLNAIAAVWIVLLAGQQLHARVSAGGFQSWFSYERGTETVAVTGTTATTTDHTALWLLGGGATALLATAGLLAQRTAGDADEAWTTLPV